MTTDVQIMRVTVSMGDSAVRTVLIPPQPVEFRALFSGRTIRLLGE